MRRSFSKTRRILVVNGTLGAAVVASGALVRRSHAQAAERVDPNDPLAQSLKYVEDASQAPADQREENEFCHNCQFFQADEQADSAPCTVLMNKIVPAGAWCNTWVMKGAGASPK